jgi:hypothetical protein
MAVGNVPDPTVSMLSKTINGVGITVTAGGATGIFQGRANNTWNNMTGTSWNNMIEDVISARDGDGTVSISLTGLDDAKQYTLTVWHNVSATDSQSFAKDLYAISPSVTTGTPVGTPTDGQATNWDRTDGKTDADYLNSVISFTPSGGSAVILLTSASLDHLLVMSGLTLETPVSTGGLRITNTGFDGSDNFYIDVEGGVTGRKVTSADDLDFTNEVDLTTTDDGNNRFFISPANRNAAKDFFRVEEAP